MEFCPLKLHVLVCSEKNEGRDLFFFWGVWACGLRSAGLRWWDRGRAAEGACGGAVLGNGWSYGTRWLFSFLGEERDE